MNPLKFFMGLMVFLLFAAVHPTTVNAQAWPFGKADWQDIDVVAADSTASATVNNTSVYLRIDTLTKNTTLHLDFVGKGPRNGSLLFIDARSAGTAKSLTAGDKLQFPVLSGTINKGKLMCLVYDSTRGKYVLFATATYD